MIDYALSSTAVAIVLVIFVVAFAFVARRVLRVAIRLALVLTILFALLLTGGVGWWRGWFFSSPKPAARPANHATTGRPAR